MLEIREGNAVTIKQIELAIVDRGLGRGLDRAAAAAHAHRPAVAVVGSGPAGLACAQQLHRAGHTRDRVRARRGRRRARPLRRPRLQDREDASSAARRAARRRRGRVPLRRRRRASTSTPRSCASATTRWCSPPARACRATCRCRVASSTASTSRWSTSTSATAGSRASTGPPPSADAPPARQAISAAGKHVIVIGGGDTGADCVGNAHREGAPRSRRSSCRRAARAPPRRAHAVAATGR